MTNLKIKNYKNNQNSYTSANFLIMLSCIFILFSDINIFNINFLSNKPLSIWFCLIFIIINIQVFFKKKWSYKEFTLCLLIIFLIAISFTRLGWTIGLSRFVSGYIGFFVVLFAFQIYIYNSNEYKMNKLFKWIFWSYFYISTIVGILQIIYIFFGNSLLIGNLFNLILYRGTNYFIGLGKYGRAPFLYGEPSFCGIYFYTFFYPAYIYMKNNKIMNKKNLNKIFIFLFILNCFSLSMRWFFDTLCFLIILLVFNIKNKKIKNKHIIYFFLILMLGFLFFLIFSKKIFTSRLWIRIQSVLNSLNIDSVDTDQSSIVRIQFIIMAIKGFLAKPIFGFGCGNYIEVVKSFLILPNNIYAKNEMLQILNLENLSSYSFYTSFLSECGIFGIIIEFIIITTLISKRNNYMKIIGFIFLYMFIQCELYGTLSTAVWLAICFEKQNIFKEKLK